MQEVFEKIKERLEEKQEYTDNFRLIIPSKKAIEIVNQVESEYNQSLANNNQSLTNSGWIPCSERLPDTEHKPHKPVLVQLKMSMVIGYANSAGQWFADCGDGCSLDVTDEAIAWQPLPEPYRGE